MNSAEAPSGSSQRLGSTRRGSWGPSVSVLESDGGNVARRLRLLLASFFRTLGTGAVELQALTVHHIM